MLLTIDIGNSNISFGLFQKKDLLREWRVTTEKSQNEKWFDEQINHHISKKESEDITAVLVGSVVPELDSIFNRILQARFNTKTHFASTNLKSNIQNLSEKPSQLGADRLADCVCAIEKYPGNRIVIDVGTATKFEVISQDNKYVGGAISPGVGVSFSSLIDTASKLSKIKLDPPKKVVGGFSTEEHLQSGYIHGFASLIDGMVRRINDEMEWNDPTVILTGGYTDMLSPFIKTRVEINKKLTLEGLRLLWELNKK